MNNSPNILSKLTALIEKNKAYIVDGSLNRNLLAADARKYNPELLNLLQKDKVLKEHFFSSTDGGLVFKKDVFLQFIMNKEFLPDSYTKYKIKIGLGAEDGSLLSESGNVVLNWPYKDAILEGGQDKEDQKRSEVFFNDVLAPDKITRLLDDKVFTNWRRYSKNGEADLDELKSTDNLVIQGNNLISLYSLRKRYAGKVNLIYIDPPFNTGGDSFGYNDRFNHSTWLTFMKNRLDAARELLAENGSIFIHIDHNEAHYLKVLCDEVFGRENFINEIIWCYTGPGSPGMKQFSRKHDNIFWYSKKGSWKFNGDDIRVASEVHVGGFGTGMDKDSSGGYENKGKIPEDWWQFAVAARVRVDGEKRTGYTTEKPPKLLERIIKATTDPGDIVLDFFAGSGTTAWVAQNLKRQYIAIEQLNSTQEILQKRLSANGEFVYANIMNNSNKYRKRVEVARNDTDYLSLLKEAMSSSFLSYRVDPKKLNEDEFRKLSASDKRRLLLELIDNNTLYVNYEDINDPIFRVSEKDKEFNKKLYEKN